MKPSKLAAALAIFVAVLAFALVPSSAFAEGTYDYGGGNWADPLQANLVSDDGGNVSVVYPVLEGSGMVLVVDVYSSSGSQLSRKRVPVPGTTWGGTLYEAPDGYRYAATGTGYGNTGTLMYVLRFDGEWNLVGQCAIDREESYAKEAFEAGNCSMALLGDRLYVTVCRLRFNGHQSNLTLILEADSMGQVYNSGKWGPNYVSHDFSSFLRVDGDRLFMVDHGDGYPRAVVAQMITPLFDEEGQCDWSDDVECTIIDIWGETGANYTGVTLDGVEVGLHNDVVAGTSVPHDHFASDDDFESYTDSEDATRNLYFGLVSKDGESCQLKWLTSYPWDSGAIVYGVRLARAGEDRFVVLYGVQAADYSESTCYMVVDSRGQVLSKGKVDQPLRCTSTIALSGDTISWVFAKQTQLGYYMLLYRWNMKSGSYRVKWAKAVGERYVKSLDVDWGTREVMTSPGKSVRLNMEASIPFGDLAYHYGYGYVPVMWTSSNPSVVAVGKNVHLPGTLSLSGDDTWVTDRAIVKAVKKGFAKVTATVGEKKLVYSIQVGSKTIDKKTVTAKDVSKAVADSPWELVLGPKVRKIAKGAFKGTKVKYLVLKTTKLTKKGVKGSLKGSKIREVELKLGTKKKNKKYCAKYGKYFTKKNCGRSVYMY